MSEGRSDTAIGSPAFEAAKEAAQARGWIMEPSVISAMLTAAVSFIREAIAREIEAERERHFSEFGNEETGPRNYDWALTTAARIASGVSGE